MSYSDDTIQYVWEGSPTSTELGTMPMPRVVTICESCRFHAAQSEVTFGDGVTFSLCERCRPFDPKAVKVIVEKGD